MTTPELPARVSLGFRKDKHLSFTGIDENRSLAHGEATIAIKDLLEEIYADATPSDDSNIAKPRLGNHFRVRWTTQGGSKLRFYLATVKRVRPKFEVPGDARTIRLRTMVEEAYDMARTDQQHAEDAAAIEAAKPAVKTAFEIEADEYLATLTPKSEATS